MRVSTEDLAPAGSAFRVREQIDDRCCRAAERFNACSHLPDERTRLSGHARADQRIDGDNERVKANPVDALIRRFYWLPDADVLGLRIVRLNRLGWANCRKRWWRRRESNPGPKNTHFTLLRT